MIRFCLICISFLLTSSFALADSSKVLVNEPDRLQAEITTSYVMGDGDSRIDARNLALEQAKRTAAELAGTYVEKETVVEDSQLQKDTVRTFAAAVMEVEVLKEHYALTSDQRMELELKITADVNKKTLRDQIERYKKDSDKRAQVEKLQKQNDSLRHELASLKKTLQQMKTQPKATVEKTPREELIGRRSEILTKLERNNDAVRSLFKRGSLLQMALEDTDRKTQVFDELETGYYGYIINNTVIELGTPEFKEVSPGKFDVYVAVEYSIPTGPFFSFMDKYFEYGIDSSNELEVHGYNGRNTGAKTVFTPELFNHIKRYLTAIKITIAGESSYLRMQAEGSFDDMEILLNTKGYAKAAYHSDDNPLIIRGLTKDQLENATSIEAKIVKIQLETRGRGFKEI